MSANELLIGTCYACGGRAVIQDPDTARCLQVASDTGLPADWMITESGVVKRTPPAPDDLVSQELLCDPCGDVIQAGGSLRLRRTAAGAWAMAGVDPRHVPLSDGRPGGGSDA